MNGTMRGVPLINTVVLNEVDRLRRSLAGGANANARDPEHQWTPLIMARSDEAVLLLLDYGAEVDARDDRGMTALMWQAIGKHRHGPNIVSILAQRGADVNARTSDGESVLHFAVASGDPARVSLLLALGARPTSEDVEEADSYGYAAMAAELRGALVM